MTNYVGYLVDENGNKYYPIAYGLFMKENGYGDKFAVKPQFSGTGDSNYLGFYSATGAAGTDPNLVLKAKIDASGNITAGKINGYSLAAACDRGVKSASSNTTLGWGTNNDYLPDISMIAYWNGAYSGTGSNLIYCLEGAIQSKPKSLYDNASGSTGTITLSESAANFTYLEIFYRDGTGIGFSYHSTRIYSPNNKYVALFNLIPANSSSMSLRYCAKPISISGTSITVPNYYDAGWFNVDGASWWHANELQIVRVVGWK